MKKFLLVVSLILVFLLVGCNNNIVEKSNLSENTNIQEEENNIISNEKVEDNKYNYTLSKRKEIQQASGYHCWTSVLVDTEGNAYLSFEYLQEDANVKKNIYTIEEKFNTYYPKNYIAMSENPDGTTTELEAYKLDIEGVLSVYYFGLGQDGRACYIFVKENGELSYLSEDDILVNGKIEIKDIDNLKNIIAVVGNTYTLHPYAIDINGNEIQLDEQNYLKGVSAFED